MNAFSKNFLPVYSTEYKGFSRICFVVRQDAWPCKSDVMRAPRCAALTITTHIHAIVIIWGITESTRKAKERSITFDKDLQCHQRDPGEVNPLTLVIHGQGHDMMIGPGRMVIV